MSCQEPQHPGAIDPQRAFAAMGEPARFRILEVLAENASTVGGVAEATHALQPQTTKHLQALEAAGLITIHKLGRRRVAQLDRAAFAALSAHLADWARPDSDDDVLESYARGIVREAADPAGRRTLSFRTQVAASAEAVWRAWTDPRVAVRWWAPRHFEVREFAIGPAAGDPIRVVLGEPGGAVYRSVGTVLEAAPRRRLVFSLAPVGEDGEPLFEAVHTLEIRGQDPAVLHLRIEVGAVRAGAAAAVAGLEPGWHQLLDGLVEQLADGSVS